MAEMPHAPVWAKRFQSQENFSRKTSTPDAGALVPRVTTPEAARRLSQWHVVLRCVVSGCLPICPAYGWEVQK